MYIKIPIRTVDSVGRSYRGGGGEKYVGGGGGYGRDRSYGEGGGGYNSYNRGEDDCNYVAVVVDDHVDFLLRPPQNTEW